MSLTGLTGLSFFMFFGTSRTLEKEGTFIISFLFSCSFSNDVTRNFALQLKEISPDVISNWVPI